MRLAIGTGLSPDFVEHYGRNNWMSAVAFVVFIVGACLIIYALVEKPEMRKHFFSFMLIGGLSLIVAGIFITVNVHSTLEKKIANNNAEIESILKEKYGAILFKPVFKSDEKIDASKMSSELREISDANGKKQFVVFSISDDRDLVVSTGAGEIDRLDKDSEISQIKPIN